MGYELNDKLKSLNAYDAISGDYEVRLDANESFLEPDDELKSKIANAVVNVDFNRYPDPMSRRLRESFARAYGVNPDVVVAGNGSDELISVIINSFMQKGDRAVTLAPDFSMYGFYCKCAECENVTVGKNSRFEIDVDDILKTVNDTGARMVIFSNPCNPTSVGAAREEMRRLVRSTDALVVLDEAYMDFWDESLINETEEYDNLVVLKTCSKALGFASVRLGFAVSNKAITGALNAVRSPYNVNSLSQEVGSIILSDKKYISSCVSKILKSRDELYGMLLKFAGDDFEIVKGNTNFIYIRTSRAKDIFEQLKLRSIIIRCFDSALRISTGSENENARLCDALDKIMTKGEF